MQKFPSWEAALGAFFMQAGRLGLAGHLPIGGEAGEQVLAAARKGETTWEEVMPCD